MFTKSLTKLRKGKQTFPPGSHQRNLPDKQGPSCQAEGSVWDWATPHQKAQWEEEMGLLEEERALWPKAG